MTIARKQTPKTLPFFDDVAFALSDARKVNLFGEINQGSMSHISTMLDYFSLKNSRRPIEIIMNSHGGSVIDGLAIYNLIQKVGKKIPINITVAGACMSMATVILQAAKIRRAYPDSQFLLHEIQYGMSGRNSAQRDYQEQAQRLQDRLNAILAGRSGMSIAELEKLIERRDYTISAQEALQHGLIDTIVE